MILDKPLRIAILAAAENAAVRAVASRYGLRFGAKRFVAGETVEEFLSVAERVSAEGFAVAAGILGEGIRNGAEAAAAARQYSALLETFALRRLDANVAFKLTHVGLDVDPQLAYENALRIAATAARTGNTIRLDMEQSRYADATLGVYRRLRERHSCVGCVLQSYLYRTAGDLQSLLPLAPNIRLVKGAYLEPSTIAYSRKADVDANYLRLAETALSGGGFMAIATHDSKLVEQVIALAHARGLPKQGRFEFQLLYGIGVPLARDLLRRGYRVRLAVPFGGYWFPYLMRRLAERPANLAFFLRGALARR